MINFPRFLPSVAAVALAFAALPAAAAQFELQAGRSYMDSHAANAVFAEGVLAEHPLGDSGLHWAPDLSLGWIDGRDIDRYRHARYGTREAIWLAAGGVRLRAGEPGDWYHHFFYSFQVALHSGRTQALSSPYEFVNSVGWQWHHLSFELRHISNGSLHEPNRGETMALVGAGFEL
ncbi:acyloxyacyl hydrolase [Rhodanobacter geophilus]|uniref:Acyloxyacyl hydrolase n=1 Tax=Rhodanobacter geophilus TaxID=3162488 RepID=A0ABV3QKF9_9GAMM